MQTGRLERIPEATTAEWSEIARAQQDAYMALLHDLRQEEWDADTECEGWTVKDIAAHVVAWADAMVWPHKYLVLAREAKRRRGDFTDDLDAQNAVQVERARTTPPVEIMARTAEVFPTFLKVRRRLLAGPLSPIKVAGPKGEPMTLRFLGNKVFSRDHFMHRVDISRAVGRELNYVPADSLMVADAAKEWAAKHGVNARLELGGPIGGTYIAGAGERATIRGDAVDFMRFLSGRGTIDAFDIEGDRAAAEAWLRGSIIF